jgi:hypothetical protein
MECNTCMHEERFREIERKIEKQSDEGNDTKLNMAIMSTKLDRLMDFMKKVDERLEKTETEPKKRWDSLITAIIQAVVVIVVALIFKGGI